MLLEILENEIKNRKPRFNEERVAGVPNKNPVVSIAMTTEPTNTQYAGRALDLTGMVITATKLDGTTEVVTDKVKKNREKWSNNANAQSVRFGYMERAIVWTVEPVEVVPASLSVKTAADTIAYRVGEEINTEGLVLEVTYNNGEKKDITEGYEYSPETMAADTTAVSLSYTEGETTVTASYDVTLIVPTALAIKTAATKTSYNVGEAVDTTGLVLTVTFSDDTEEDIESGFEASPEEVAADTTAVTVTYTEAGVSVSTSYAITVTE